MRKDNPSFTSKRRERFYRRAMSLALVAITVFAVSFSIYWAFTGMADKIFIVLIGSAFSCLVIFLFRRARGILDTAFTVPFLIYSGFLAAPYETAPCEGIVESIFSTAIAE